MGTNAANRYAPMRRRKLIPSFDIPAPTSNWPAPGNFTATPTSPTTVSLSWTIPAPDPMDGTTIFRYWCIRDSQILEFDANLSSPQVISGLEPGRTYYWTLRAVDNLDQWGPGAIDDATTPLV